MIVQWFCIFSLCCEIDELITALFVWFCVMIDLTYSILFLFLLIFCLNYRLNLPPHSYKNSIVVLFFVRCKIYFHKFLIILYNNRFNFFIHFFNFFFYFFCGESMFELFWFLWVFFRFSIHCERYDIYEIICVFSLQKKSKNQIDQIWFKSENNIIMEFLKYCMVMKWCST